MCEKCEFPCHYHCAKEVPKVCPLPREDMERKPIGLNTLDIHKAKGTAYHGIFWIPKPQGVKRGWVKQYGVISGNRLIMFGFVEGKTPIVSCLSTFCQEEFKTFLKWHHLYVKLFDSEYTR